MGGYHVRCMTYSIVYLQTTLRIKGQYFYFTEEKTEVQRSIAQIRGLVSRRVYIQTRICLPDLKGLLFLLLYVTDLVPVLT